MSLDVGLDGHATEDIHAGVDKGGGLGVAGVREVTSDLDVVNPSHVLQVEDLDIVVGVFEL